MQMAPWKCGQAPWSASMTPERRVWSRRALCANAAPVYASATPHTIHVGVLACCSLGTVAWYVSVVVCCSVVMHRLVLVRLLPPRL